MIECYKNSEQYKISFSDILFVEAFDDDVYIVTSNDQFKVRKRLYEFEQEYYSKGFVRVNKSTVVNIMMITSILPLFNSKLKLILVNKKAVYVTRTFLKSFKNYLYTGGVNFDY